MLPNGFATLKFIISIIGANEKMRWFNYFYVEKLCWPHLACITVKAIYVLRGKRADSLEMIWFEQKVFGDS